MMSSIAKSSALGLALLLSACASVDQLRDIACAPNAAPKPRWIDRTAFELNLPADYYYGTGSARKREDATAQAYADLARAVSVRIFSREIVQQIDEKLRAESVAQAISDVEAKGIQTIGMWQDPASCDFHIMVRVDKHIAASWKQQAQSYFTHRPGLGRVRRPDFEIHAMRYREIGRPTLAIEWDQAAARLEQNRAAIFETALRRALQRSGIKITTKSGRAKYKVLLSVAQNAPIAIEAELADKSGREIARYTASDAANDKAIERAAERIALNLLNIWLVE